VLGSSNEAKLHGVRVLLLSQRTLVSVPGKPGQRKLEVVTQVE
jgi:hypothetical protein